MFAVLRQYIYSFLVVSFLFNLVSCDDAELENPTGIGVYALRNETKEELYFRIDGDSIYMDTNSVQVIKVHYVDNAPALPILGLPEELEFFYVHPLDTAETDVKAVKIKTKEMNWTPTKFDEFPIGHVQYLDTLVESMLIK